MPQLDLTQHHSIHGAGPGKDIIFQIGDDGKPYIYDRTGTVLEPNSQDLARRGLVMTEALRLQMSAALEVKKQDELERRLKEAMRRAEEQERARIQRGLPPSWELDESELGEEEEVDEEFTQSLLDGIE